MEKTVPMRWQKCAWRDCGSKFIPVHGRQLYCCKDCARQAKNDKGRKKVSPDLYEAKRIAAMPKVPPGINEILRECDRMNISYGRYVQLKEAGVL